MESLRQNKPLLWSIAGSISAVICLVSGIFPDMCHQFSVVEFEPEFQNVVLGVLALDLLSAFVIDRTLDFICGKGQLRNLL